MAMPYNARMIADRLDGDNIRTNRLSFELVERTYTELKSQLSVPENLEGL